MKETPLILVSNDDGLDSVGLRLLADGLRELGRVVIVAPDQQRSAASQSITLHRPLRICEVEKDVYSIDGTPTDCVLLGIHGILKRKPDLVVSGINQGPNLGEDVHYSGTVSAAYEGGIKGVSSFAISLVMNGGEHFDTAAGFAVRLSRTLLKDALPKGVILNVNVPDVPADQIKDYVFTRQGKRDYGSMIIEKEDPRGKKYYWIGGHESRFIDIAGSDCNAINEGKISITPLRIDITDDDSFDNLKDLKI